MQFVTFNLHIYYILIKYYKQQLVDVITNYMVLN